MEASIAQWIHLGTTLRPTGVVASYEMIHCDSQHGLLIV